MATLSALRTKVANNLGGRTDKNTQIDGFLNRAQSDIASKYNFNDLMTTDSSGALASTDYTEALPSTIRKVERVVIKDSSDNYYNVRILGRKTFRSIWPEIVPATSGPSTECFIEGRTIYFSHKADKAYTVYIDGTTYTTDMSEDSDTPSITGIDDALVAQATAYMYMHLKQQQEAGMWFQIAQSEIMNKLDEISSPVGQLMPW